MSSITPQAQAIYKLLRTNPPLTAREIAKKLDILPNAIYRSIKVLHKFGFIKKIGRYPVRYASLESSEAVETFTQTIKENLLQSFALTNKASRNTNLDVSFISDREDLIEKSNVDLGKTSREVSLIVSGLEVPAETMLANKTAVDRGVIIRIIVQNLDEAKKERLKNWQKMGIKVRYYPLLEARIIILDSKIAYITSYHPEEKEEGIGVRFDYSPVARLLQDLFDQRWAKAKNIT